MLIGIGCRRGAGNFLTELDEARRVTADARIQFSQGADASGRAVMADTDEASVQSAQHAEALLNAVQSDVVVLERLLQSLQFANERETLQRFKGDFAKYQALERTILALAVENTNLKAQRLSFGPAREAAKSFRDSLGALPPSVPSKDRCRVETLVSKATSALSEIQALQAPHIAEPDDATMTKLEREMNALEAAAKSTLDELSGLVQPNARDPLTAASTALERFKAVSTEIVNCRAATAMCAR